jgi:hypothetical protein
VVMASGGGEGDGGISWIGKIPCDGSTDNGLGLVGTFRGATTLREENTP